MTNKQEQRQTSHRTVDAFSRRIRVILPIVLFTLAAPSASLAQVTAPEAEASYQALLKALKSLNEMTAEELSDFANKVDAALTQMEAAGLSTTRERVRDSMTGQTVPGRAVLEPYYAGLRRFRESLGPILELRLSGSEIAESRLIVLSIELSNYELSRQAPPPAWNGTVYPVLKTSCVLAVPYPKSWDDASVHQITDACPFIPFYSNRNATPGGTPIERVRNDIEHSPAKYAEEGRRLVTALLGNTKTQKDQVGAELVIVRPPEWGDQTTGLPRRWADSDKVTASFPFDVKHVEPIIPWPDTGRMGPTARDQVRRTYVDLMLHDFRPTTLKNCASIVKLLVVDAATALVKEQTALAEKARLEEERQEEAQASQEAAAEQHQQLLKKRQRDPRYMSPVLSARLCKYQRVRTSAMNEIRTERNYGKSVGGVVDLTKLHRLQNAVRYSDELIAKTKKRIQGIKGASESPCTSPIVVRLSECLGYVSGPEMADSDACDDEKMGPYIEVANAEEDESPF